jgi:hypothetical protein
MSTPEARCATHLDERLSLQPECHEPCVHVEALWRGKELPFDYSTACSRRVVEAS